MKLFVLHRSGTLSWRKSGVSKRLPSGGLVVKRFIAGATLLVSALSAVAQPLRQTTSLKCRDAAALVASSGAIVLGTGPHTYERFVSGAGCGMTSEAPAWVAALDTPQCFIGYRCVNRSN
jgi:hypothetical protein